MTFAVNGKRLLVASLTEPSSGAWVLDVEVESDAEITGPLTAELGSSAAALVGTKVRGTMFRGRWVARIVGGKGGLSVPVESRYYDAVTVKTILDALMVDSGEELDATVSPALLGTSVSRWMRPAGTPGEALDDLAAELGVVWRVTRAGKVWLGTESWPTLTATAAEITPGPAAGTVSIAPEGAALVRPGVTYLGKRVSSVQTMLSGGKLRQLVWHDESAGDRILASLTAIVERILGRRTLYLGTYPSAVVRQSTDGLSLEVLPDDPRICGAGLKRVPIRHGSPGWGVRVPKGARLSVGFDAGDPRLPYVASWEPGSVDSVTFGGGTQGVVRQGDMVSLPLTAAQIVQLAACFNSAAPGSPVVANPAIIAAAAVPSAPIPPPFGPITLYGCTTSASAKFRCA